MSGATSYRAGLAAEAAAERHYRNAGLRTRARRWRGSGGEVDLVIQDGSALIFVEVKKSWNYAQAAARVSRRQMQRIHAGASEFLAGEPWGQLTEARFDVALVDDAARVQIVENAFGH